MTGPRHALIRALVEDAAELPSLAATHARRRRRAQRRLRLASSVTLALLLVVATLATLSSRLRPLDQNQSPIAQQKGQPDPSPSAGTSYVIVQHPDEAEQNPAPYPEDLTPDQQRVFERSGGLPILLVHRGPGEPARLYVVER